MSPVCTHGPMKELSGYKNGKEWRGFFCPTPKGTPDQCAPIWPKTTPQGTTRATAPQKPQSEPNTASQGLLQEVLKEVKATKALVEYLVNEYPKE